jgi:NAD(P)-binding Rossmann-like domain
MIEAERAALRRRYAQERDTRLRPDGNDQYLERKGRFSHLLTDPYTPRTERAPRRDHVRFAFVGGGFAGLATGARLKEASVRDVRIVEKGGGFGGTAARGEAAGDPRHRDLPRPRFPHQPLGLRLHRQRS